MTACVGGLPPLSVGGRGGYATEKPPKAPFGLQVGGTAAGLQVGGRGCAATDKPPKPSSLRRVASLDRAGPQTAVGQRQAPSGAPSPLRRRGTSVDCPRPQVQ